LRWGLTLGAEILRFIADNAARGFRATLAPMQARAIRDVRNSICR
jgi:hypothetical protein